MELPVWKKSDGRSGRELQILWGSLRIWNINIQYISPHCKMLKLSLHLECIIYKEIELSPHCMVNKWCWMTSLLHSIISCPQYKVYKRGCIIYTLQYILLDKVELHPHCNIYIHVYINEIKLRFDCKVYLLSIYM